MSAIPGVAPALIELEQVLINQAVDYEHLYFVLEAIRMRNDLDETHQAWLRTQLQPLIGQNPNGITHVLKERGLMILSKYPGVENEKLLISYLDDHDGEKSKFGFSATAAEGLGFIGTSNALKPLQDYADRIKPLPGHSDHHYDYAIAAISAVKSNMAPAGDTSGEESSKTSIAPKNRKIAEYGTSASSLLKDGSLSSTLRVVWGILTIAVTSLLWLLFKRRK